MGMNKDLYPVSLHKLDNRVLVGLYYSKQSTDRFRELLLEEMGTREEGGFRYIEEVYDA